MKREIISQFFQTNPFKSNKKSYKTSKQSINRVENGKVAEDLEEIEQERLKKVQSMPDLTRLEEEKHFWGKPLSSTHSTCTQSHAEKFYKRPVAMTKSVKFSGPILMKELPHKKKPFLSRLSVNGTKRREEAINTAPEKSSLKRTSKKNCSTVKQEVPKNVLRKTQSYASILNNPMYTKRLNHSFGLSEAFFVAPIGVDSPKINAIRDPSKKDSIRGTLSLPYQVKLNDEAMPIHSMQTRINDSKKELANNNNNFANSIICEKENEPIEKCIISSTKNVGENYVYPRIHTRVNGNTYNTVNDTMHPTPNVMQNNTEYSNPNETFEKYLTKPKSYVEKSKNSFVEDDDDCSPYAVVDIRPQNISRTKTWPTSPVNERDESEFSHQNLRRCKVEQFSGSCPNLISDINDVPKYQFKENVLTDNPSKRSQNTSACDEKLANFIPSHTEIMEKFYEIQAHKKIDENELYATVDKSLKAKERMNMSSPLSLKISIGQAISASVDESYQTINAGGKALYDSRSSDTTYQIMNGNPFEHYTVNITNHITVFNYQERKPIFV